MSPARPLTRSRISRRLGTVCAQGQTRSARISRHPFQLRPKDPSRPQRRHPAPGTARSRTRPAAPCWCASPQPDPSPVAGTPNEAGPQPTRQNNDKASDRAVFGDQPGQSARQHPSRQPSQWRQLARAIRQRRRCWAGSRVLGHRSAGSTESSRCDSTQDERHPIGLQIGERVAHFASATDRHDVAVFALGDFKREREGAPESAALTRLQESRGQDVALAVFTVTCVPGLMSEYPPDPEHEEPDTVIAGT